MGEPSQILTRQELLASKEGRRALMDWRAGDSSQHLESQRRLLHQAGKADVRMLAERGDPRARDLLSRGLPQGDVERYLEEESASRKPGLSVVD